MIQDPNHRMVRLLGRRIASRPEPDCWLGLVIRAFPLATGARGQTPAPSPDPSTVPGPEVDPPDTPQPGPGPAPQPQPSPGIPPSPAPTPGPGPGPMPRPEIPSPGSDEVQPTRPDTVPQPLPSNVPTGTPPEIDTGTSTPEISPGSTPMEVPPTTGRSSAPGVPAPVHWLAAGWRPDESGLYPRWPEFAAIASPDADRALAELVERLPDAARVHLVSPAHVDPALVAEIVLAVDRNLQPWHRDGLRAFIDARRLDDRQVIRARYTDRDDRFERFRDALRRDVSDPGGARVS